MPPALLSRDEVLTRLMTVFRHFGYDGASLNELSKASGLGRSSLYHYFPEGKDDMVRAVLAHLADQLRSAAFVPLRAAGPPARRIDAMIHTIDGFYAHGKDSCLLAQLVLGSTRSRFGGALQEVFREWVAAIAAVLVEAGLSRAIARQRAEDAVMRIEGALVLAGGLDDPRVFTRMLKQLPASLLA